MRHHHNGLGRLVRRPLRMGGRLLSLAGAAALGYYLLEKNKQRQGFNSTEFVDPLEDQSPEVIDIDVEGNDSDVF
ncbi:MAG: hypothetical protein MUO40_09975 [Anaerolineaceae bacterium]|nr:hypothetical protein [Anaerolineaceae bacterium]